MLALVMLVALGAENQQGDIEGWLKLHQAQTVKMLAAAKKARIGKAPQLNVYDEKYKRYVFQTKEHKAAEVERLEKELVSPTLPTLDLLAMRDGDIGSLNHQHGVPFEVIQILGEENALVRVDFHGAGDCIFWLKARSAVRAIREGGKYQWIGGAYRIAGRRQYTTATGAAKTVSVVESYDLSPHLAKLRKKDER